MILDRKRRNGPGVVSKIVPLEACEEIDCWWHPDEDGPAPVLDARPSTAPNVVSPRVMAASAVSAKTASGAAALPVAAPATSVTTPLPTVTRLAPFRSRRPPPPRYHPGAVFDSTPVRRNTGQIFLGLVLGL